MGFSVASCAKVEYGTPYSTFRVSGKVVDETGQPVNNILVTPMSDSQVYNTQTDNYGEFSVIGRSGPGSFDKVVVAFSDIDGDQNGGVHEGKTVEISLVKTREPSKDDSGWYQGEFSASDQDITLKKIK